MVEISVLLYVFNDDEFLNESVESILNQSFKDLELICINDESTDKSLEILNKYAQDDDRIKVYSHKHCGFTSSVNNVINSINGNYVQILNAGTSLDKNALSAMFEKAEEEKTDIVMANIKNRDKNGKEYENNEYSLTKVVNLCGDKIFGFDDVREIIFELTPSLENKLYSVKFLTDNDIALMDDSEYDHYIFFYESLFSAEKICCLNEFLFIHRDVFDALNNRNSEKLMNIPLAANKIMILFKKYGKLENNKDIYNFLFSRTMKGYYSINEVYKDDYFNEIRTYLKSLLKSDEIDDFLENITDYNRKIFEQIIISENAYEFNRLQKTYYEKIEYNKLLNRKRFLQPYIEKMNEN